MPARPFPFASLPSCRRAEAALARRVLRHLAPAPPSARDVLGPPWHALLDGAVTAAPSPPRVDSPATVRARYEGAALAAVAQHPTLGVIVALADRGPALTLAARCLGAAADEARATAAAGVLTPALEGALALLVARAGALAWAPSPPPQVRGVTESVATALEALAPGDNLPGTLVVWPWRYTAGITGGEVSLVALATAVASLPPTVTRVQSRVGDVSLALSVVAGRAALAASVVASLGVGDALTLDGITRAEGGIAGAVTLALGDPWGAELPAVVTATGTVQITGAAAPWRRQAVANGDDEQAVRTEVLAGLPVDVVVEIARGTATVGEVSAWRVGEVVTLGQRLGEAVTVRAGGRVVARGELVDVEGEVGVRVTELL